MKLERANQTIIEQTINVCNLSKVNTFSRLVVDELKKAIEFEIKCPFKAGLYHFNSRDKPQKSIWKSVIPSWMKLDDPFNMVMTFKTRQKTGLEVISLLEYLFYIDGLMV